MITGHREIQDGYHINIAIIFIKFRLRYILHYVSPYCTSKLLEITISLLIDIIFVGYKCHIFGEYLGQQVQN